MQTLFGILLAATCMPLAAADRYALDPAHTFPSFEADHMGISVWRGKFNRTAGAVTLDRKAETGRLEVTIDMASVDFGHDKLNEWAAGPEFFDTAKFPEARYVGTLRDFRNGAPTRAEGKLTLHGVTQPVELHITHFKCIPHPLHQRELCGADAHATIERDGFGLTAGKDYGFDMSVALRIQVEAVREE